MDSVEFRALLLLLVGWRKQHELDQVRLEQVIQSYRSDLDLRILGFKRAEVPTALVAIDVRAPNEGLIRHIVVSPELRGRGLGRALLRAAQSRLNVSSLSAETDVSAVGFYESCGFRASSLGEKYPGVERFLCKRSF